MRMPFRHLTFLLLSAAWFVAGGPGWCAEEAGDAAVDNGLDVTRPKTRFDLRYDFQNKGQGVRQHQIIFRLEQPIPLTQDQKWKLAMRLDVPMVFNNKPGPDNPAGRTTFGLGDVLLQVVLVNAPTERFGYGVGLRALFPTASADQFGSGKYRLVPIVGARFSLPEISPGSYFEPIVRYDSDVGGYGGRSRISQLRLGPMLNIQLPRHWYVTLFPSQDIVLNTVDGHKWFLPADFLVGRRITKDTVAAVEVSVPIVKEFTLYDFKLQFRFSRSF